MLDFHGRNLNLYCQYVFPGSFKVFQCSYWFLQCAIFGINVLTLMFLDCTQCCDLNSDSEMFLNQLNDRECLRLQLMTTISRGRSNRR
ncbi:hypothetical protein Trydic_g18275 [Trypoxylus dichotomus]